jgi:5'(3')-deoxyribonucleotidase
LPTVLNEQILLYNREFKERLTVSELRGRWIRDFVPPDLVRAPEKHIQSDDFFERLAVIPHSQRVLERLQRCHDVYIATAVMEYPSLCPKNTNG